MTGYYFVACAVIPSKCKIQECTYVGESLLDPCSERHYYVCSNSKIWMPCPVGTHFTSGNCLSIYSTISEKEKFWKACNIPKNFSMKQCRKIWPKDATQWDKAKIDEFLFRNNSMLPPSPPSPPSPQQIKYILIPFITISFFLLCLLVVIIVLLKERKKYKQTNSNIRNKNNLQPEKENEESIYEEIDENQMITTVPALVVDLPEIDHRLDISQNLPNKKKLHENRCFNQEAFIDTDNQEGQYNVLDIVGIQQNLKSSEMLHDGYSSCNFNCAENSDNSTYNTVSTYESVI